MNRRGSDSGALARASHTVNKTALLSALVLILTNQPAFAGSATWVGDPPYGDKWYDADYWQPNTVPQYSTNVATFDVSDQTSVDVTLGGYRIDSIVFNPGASAYRITIDTVFKLSGAGIVNNSGIMQNFTVLPYGYPGNLQNITFLNKSNAGDMVHFTSVGSNEGDVYGGAVFFEDFSTAGTAMFTNEATEDSDYAGTTFYNSSTAQNAIIINEAATYLEDDGGSTWFADRSTAGNANIVNKGTASSAGEGGVVYFGESSNAADSTITCEASMGGPYYPAAVWFSFDSDGGRSRIILHGDGTLYTYFRNPGTVTIGSLEGDGHVVIAWSDDPVVLAVGSNNLSTTFSGLLEQFNSEPGPFGSLRKIGTGRLILTNANTYGGGTTVEAGTLLVNNTSGSGTGSGRVLVTGGTFGGAGTVAGAVIAGTGSGTGAFLAPGKSGVKSGTLTIQRKLTLKADATYNVTVDTRNAADADKISCAGVSIRRALIRFKNIGTRVLPPGTILTVIDNTAATAIAGTFRNLSDGGTVRIGSNTFQANYEGGDGNELTLTVIRCRFCLELSPDLVP